MPPDNNESDGDSENSDDEQSLARPFADHLTPQILKGEGSAAIVDESGLHEVGTSNGTEDGDEQLPVSVAGADAVTALLNTLPVKSTKRLLNRKSLTSKRPKQQVEVAPRAESASTEVTAVVAGPSASVTSYPTATAGLPAVLHDSLPRIWKKVDFKSSQSDRFTWNSNETISLPDMDPSEYFELFWDDALFEKIRYFSKLYSLQQDPKSLFDVTVQELKVMVGILLISGYSTVPRRRLYWSSECDVRNEMIASAMSRNRFDEILASLHCANNAELPPGDRFGKVRPLINMLNNKYMRQWPVSQNSSIDETMIPYYGHHGCKQHIHGKPIRFGFKIWSLNASSDGYCCQFEPYQGAGSGIRIQQLGLGGSVVVDLLSQLPKDVHYRVYADNFFSSLALADHLGQSYIGYTGTIRENRTQKCPVMTSKELAKKTRGEFDFRQDTANGLIVTKWHDNAVVSVVSNCHGVEPLRSASRWSAKEKKHVTVTVPDMVHQYNRFMGGTDLMDRNISNYRVTIRMKKWWWSVFSFLLSSSVVNAWCIHRRAKSEKLDLLNFTRQIAISYVLNYSKRPQIGRPPAAVPKHVMRRVVPDDVRKSPGHFPTSTTQNRCRVCQRNTKRGCGKCGINLHDSCFMVFHND